MDSGLLEIWKSDNFLPEKGDWRTARCYICNAAACFTAIRDLPYILPGHHRPHAKAWLFNNRGVGGGGAIPPPKNRQRTGGKNPIDYRLNHFSKCYPKKIERASNVGPKQIVKVKKWSRKNSCRINLRISTPLNYLRLYICAPNIEDIKMANPKKLYPVV